MPLSGSSASAAVREPRRSRSAATAAGRRRIGSSPIIRSRSVTDQSEPDTTSRRVLAPAVLDAATALPPFACALLVDALDAMSDGGAVDGGPEPRGSQGGTRGPLSARAGLTDPGPWPRCRLAGRGRGVAERSDDSRPSRGWWRLPWIRSGRGRPAGRRGRSCSRAQDAAPTPIRPLRRRIRRRWCRSVFRRSRAR